MVRNRDGQATQEPFEGGEPRRIQLASRRPARLQLGDPTPAPEAQVGRGYGQKPSDLGRGELPGGAARRGPLGGTSDTGDAGGPEATGSPAAARTRRHGVNHVAVDRHLYRIVPASVANPALQIPVELHDESRRRETGGRVVPSSDFECTLLGGPQDPAQLLARSAALEPAPLTGREDPGVEARVLGTRARLTIT